MGRFVVKDTYFKKAKLDGFRARSAYKLKEIIDKFPIIKKGDRVFDVGCAPGSFIQVISSIVGSEGFIVGIDILPVKQFSSPNIKIIKGDIREFDIEGLLNAYGFNHFDVITSDIAPNLSGIREVDDKNYEELYIAVKKIIDVGLKKGGHALIKSFITEGLKSMGDELKTVFKKVSIYKPSASRSGSSEIYFVCIDKKGSFTT